jgi:hypothetical protein
MNGLSPEPARRDTHGARRRSEITVSEHLPNARVIHSGGGPVIQRTLSGCEVPLSDVPSAASEQHRVPKLPHPGDKKTSLIPCNFAIPPGLCQIFEVLAQTACLHFTRA